MHVAGAIAKCTASCTASCPLVLRSLRPQPLHPPNAYGVLIIWRKRLGAQSGGTIRIAEQTFWLLGAVDDVLWGTASH